MKFKITKFNPKSIRDLLKEEKVICEEVEGEPITINGIKCFIFEESDETDHGTITGYNISHLYTGMRIISDLSKKQAIIKAENRLRKWPDAIDKGILICKNLGVSLPVNV